MATKKPAPTKPSPKKPAVKSVKAEKVTPAVKPSTPQRTWRTEAKVEPQPAKPVTKAGIKAMTKSQQSRHTNAAEKDKGSEKTRKHPETVKSTQSEQDSASLAPLTDRQMRFADNYLVDLNATQAAIRAGYSESNARVVASENLTKPNIIAYIEEKQRARLGRLEIDQDRVVRELWNILTADPNELVEYRRTCCRFCYGEGFRYQRTANEMEQAWEEFAESSKKAATAGEPTPVFDVKGGIGYDARKDPHEDCAECFGRGVGTVHVKDTRTLSPAARALYAGVKQTKEGLEVKMHDKQGFAQLLMRHAGMLNDKLKLQGDPNAPLEVRTKVVVVPQKQAAVVETKTLPKGQE